SYAFPALRRHRSLFARLQGAWKSAAAPPAAANASRLPQAARENANRPDRRRAPAARGAAPLECLCWSVPRSTPSSNAATAGASFFSLAQRQEIDDPRSQPNQRSDLRTRYRPHLPIPTIQGIDEVQERVQSRLRYGINLAVGCGRGLAGPQRGDGGIDLALFAAGGDARKNFPRIGFSFEMVTPISPDRHPPNQVPRLQFLDRVGDVRTRQSEPVGDLFGRNGALAQVQQRVDLGDRAIDAPLAAHITPLQHELLDGRRQLPRAEAFIRFRNFCHDRNFRRTRYRVKGFEEAKTPQPGAAAGKIEATDSDAIAQMWPHRCAQRRPQ